MKNNLKPRFKYLSSFLDNMDDFTPQRYRFESEKKFFKSKRRLIIGGFETAEGDSYIHILPFHDYVNYQFCVN